MRRVDVGDTQGSGPSSAKRKLAKTASGSEENLAAIQKPGLETSYPHIAQMWIGKDNDVALELTYHLRRPCAERLGIRRRSID